MYTPHIVNTAATTRHLQVTMVCQLLQLLVIIRHRHRRQVLELQAARTTVEPGAQVIQSHRQEVVVLQGIAVPVPTLKPHQQ